MGANRWADNEPHYRFHENDMLTNGQRRFMKREARKRFPPGEQRNETLRWINNRQRTRRELEQLCKRWGIDIEDTWK